MIKDGVRTRVEEPTRNHAERNTQRNSDGAAIGYEGKPVQSPASAKE